MISQRLKSQIFRVSIGENRKLLLREFSQSQGPGQSPRTPSRKKYATLVDNRGIRKLLGISDAKQVYNIKCRRRDARDQIIIG